MIDPQRRAQDFPSLTSKCYLNTAAESIPPVCVGEALQEYWRDKLLGMKGRDGHYARVEQCREIAARSLGLAPAEVAFCSCSAEAYNLLATAVELRPGDEVVISDLDFPSGATPWLANTRRHTVRVWRNREGQLEAQDLPQLLNARTRLVQVSLVSFFNGQRIDWRPFHDAVRRYAPNALIAVDVTQALGRVPLDCRDADITISSTHKWTLGIHGGCIVGIPQARAAELTTRAGGWFHLENAFDADRFERVATKKGAPSFATGMPNFAAIYALNASLRYLAEIGIENIARHADPLTERTVFGLQQLGLKLMAPWSRKNPSGIMAFRHPRTADIHAALERANIHVMHHAGRLRVAIHGYNTSEDVSHFLGTMETTLATLG